MSSSSSSLGLRAITRESMFLWLAAVLIAGTGCSNGGSTFNIQNPSSPAQQQQVAIAFQSAPPPAVRVSGTATITAVVSNDPTNAGVDWSLPCPVSTNCGALSSVHTDSGQTVTYTAPSSLSANSLVANIVAFATADHSKNVAAAISVTAFTGFLQSGAYVIETSGSDSFGFPYQRAGVIMLNGNGGVTGGEQTVNFFDQNAFLPTSLTDPVTGGSYTIGADGRGTLTINTNHPNIGQNGIETFSSVLLSSSHVLVTASSGESSVGTLDLQNPEVITSPPAKGYAFVANGIDTNTLPLGIGGVFNIDSSQAISGTGSTFDYVSPANTGLPGAISSSTVHGTVSTLDPFGAFQVSLVTHVSFTPTVQFTCYPVDATHIKLIESDGSAAITIGQAIAQGSATGSFTTRSTFTGNYVFGIFGRDLGGGAASLAAAGLFSTTGTGTLTNGFIDESQSSIPLQISDSFQATYAVGPAGTGRFHIPVSTVTTFPDFTFTDPNNGTGPAWIFYLSGNGGPALMLDADVEPSFVSGSFLGGGVGTGIAYPVTTGASFSGPYGTIFTQSLVGSEQDVVGEMGANGGALSGVLDIDNAFGAVVTDDTSLSGNYQNSAVSNRLTGTLTDAFFPNIQLTNSLSMAFYPIDSTQGFFVENDVGDNAGTQLSGDLTFGYYTTRTPVCQGCQ